MSPLRRLAQLLAAASLSLAAGAAFAAPAFQAAGAAQGATGGVTVPWPAHQAGDVALLFVETQGSQAVSFSNARGFQALPDSPQSVNNPQRGTRLSVFWARATSGAMLSPQIADPGNHVYAVILTYRGVVSTGNPWDATAGGNNNGNNTSITVPGVTTTVPDTLIVQAVTRQTDSGAAFVSNQTNANLTGIAERFDDGTT
ncbi:MAG: hypothetical protein AB7K53_08780, partial [Burkholderiales bacterium]